MAAEVFELNEKGWRDMAETQRELPKYRCHKVVHALKIKDVITSLGAVLTFEDQQYAPKPVDQQWFGKHNPEPGGYYVVYDDGYASYSPAKAFEDGYTLIQ